MDNPELKHSPGPWYMISGDSYIYSEGQSTAKGGDGGDVVARSPAINIHAKSLAHWPHNSKLICAAPDLLNAAYMAYFHLTSGGGDPDFFIKQLADAIDKATK